MGLFSKPKAPKAPDLNAATDKQNTLNQDTANYIMNANRYGQSTPLGSNEWVTGPDGRVTNQTTLSPEQQALYTGNNQNAQTMNNMVGSGLNQFASQYWGGGGGSSGGMVPGNTGGGGSVVYAGGSGTASGAGGSASGGIPGGMYNADKATGVGGVGGGIQGDLDYSKLTAMPTTDPAVARQQAQDALYKMQAQYLDPQWQESQRSMETQLSNKGLVPGTPAYNNAMQVMNDAKQKAYSNAEQSAIAGGGAEQERQQALALALRNQGITEAGNQGAFHNAAQAQRAGEILTDTGQRRGVEQANIGANASMSNAATAAAAQQNIAQGRLGLDTRNEAFNELMGMNSAGKPMLPQFGTSQGNMTPYSAPNYLGATTNNYSNELAGYNASKNSGLMGMLPGVGSFLGSGGLSGLPSWLSSLGESAGPLLLAG